MRLVNLTAHRIRVLVGDQVLSEFPPSGRVARLRELSREMPALLTDHGTVPLITIAYADVADLPDAQDGTAYIVSRVLAAAVPRQDLYFPATEVRDADGQIIGCTGLGSFDLAHRDDDDA